MAKEPAKKAALPDARMAFTELASSDPEATRRFLEKIFGWSFKSVKMLGGDYLSFEAAGARGGIRVTQPKEVPNSTNYVRVQDLDTALAKINHIVVIYEENHSFDNLCALGRA